MTRERQRERVGEGGKSETEREKRPGLFGARSKPSVCVRRAVLNVCGAGHLVRVATRVEREVEMDKENLRERERE